MKNIRKNQKGYDGLNLSGGFTLIETFVAITILMIIVLGPMSLLSNALKNSRHIGDEITATYLAQEGTELVIDYRNNNNPGKIDSLVSESKQYYFDNSMENFGNCGNPCLTLKFDNVAGYQYTQGNNSLFTRTIKITRVATGQYLIVSSVSWPGSPRSPIVSSSIIFKKN